MKMLQYMNMTLYTTLVMSTLMAISSTNMFMTWLSLELNMFSFIPLLLTKSNYNEIEASITYFLTQTLGSTMFLYTSFMLMSLHMLMEFNTLLMILSMLLKMGAFPCHYWYPMTMENISWMSCLILSSWQKIVPLSITMYIFKSKMTHTNQLTMLIISSLNSITGGLMGLSQSSLKKLMAYSSITHMGWMLSNMTINMQYMSMIYLTMYSMMIIPLFILFNKMNSNKVSDLWHKQKSSMMLNTTMLIMLLSLGGIPPLTGFIPKLLLIYALLNYSMMMVMLLIIGSIMNLFYYMNISLNMLMSNQETKYKKMNMSVNMLNNMNSMNILGLTMLLL